MGWSELEYAAIDVPFEQRGSITDEYLQTIIAAWEGDRVDFTGEFVSCTDVATGPQPVRSPHPPVWVGGTSRSAIRRAARFGDAWHPIGAEVAWLRDVGLPALRDEAERLGRPTPGLAPRMRVQPTTSPPGAKRRTGTGTISQILHDLEDLVDVVAIYVVLDTNPDHASDRRPPEHDWKALQVIARAFVDT